MSQNTCPILTCLRENSGSSPAVTMVAGTSELQVTNKEEGYDLHGILTVKREESKSVWVLCHGLCSSCQGTVPRFVSEELDANTFRQVSRLRFVAFSVESRVQRFTARGRSNVPGYILVLRTRSSGTTRGCVRSLTCYYRELVGASRSLYTVGCQYQVRYYVVPRTMEAAACSDDTKKQRRALPQGHHTQDDQISLGTKTSLVLTKKVPRSKET